MVNFPGRNGRRRRVLNEEVLSGSTARAANRTTGDEHSTEPPLRYSDAAGVENHAQITDFVPRRYRTIALLVLTGIASTVALAGLHYAAPLVAKAIGAAVLPPFDLAATGNLAGWVASLVLLLTSAMCLLVYSIRRHRIDDYRGRYRIWLAAAAACVVLSANSVAGLHHALAFTLSHVTGWTALRSGAVWWLVLAGLPLAWIVARTLRDLLECRLAAALWLGAIGCYAVATVCYLGFVPAARPPLDAMFDAGLALVGHWLMLAAVVAYARYVVLDAQGLIPLRRQPQATAKVDSISRKKATGDSSYNDVAKKASDIQRAEPTAGGADWIDGSRPEREHYDDGDDDSPGSRKLSKADRKRLRKLKAQNRAA